MRATRDFLQTTELSSCASAPSSTSTSRTPTASTTSPRSPARSPTKNRADVSERFADPAARKSVDLDLALMDTYDNLLREVERRSQHARAHDHDALRRLQTIPGVGKILALAILYEVGASTASPASRTSSPTAGWSSAERRPAAKTTATAVKRSATPTSSGPSPRRPSSSCKGTTPRAGYLQKRLDP